MTFLDAKGFEKSAVVEAALVAMASIDGLRFPTDRLPVSEEFAKDQALLFETLEQKELLHLLGFEKKLRAVSDPKTSGKGVYALPSGNDREREVCSKFADDSFREKFSSEEFKDYLKFLSRASVILYRAYDALLRFYYGGGTKDYRAFVAFAGEFSSYAQSRKNKALLDKASLYGVVEKFAMDFARQYLTQKSDEEEKKERVARNLRSKVRRSEEDANFAAEEEDDRIAHRETLNVDGKVFVVRPFDGKNSLFSAIALARSVKRREDAPYANIPALMERESDASKFDTDFEVPDDALEALLSSSAAEKRVVSVLSSVEAAANELVENFLRETEAKIASPKDLRDFLIKFKRYVFSVGQIDPFAGDLERAYFKKVLAKKLCDILGERAVGAARR